MSLRHTIVSVAIATACTSALAFDFFDNTFLVELKQGGVLTDKASAMGDTRYESQTGSLITLNHLYRSSWTDMHATFMTQLSPQFGIVWGVSTGERAKKYEIAPSFKLGAVFMQPVTKNSSLTFRGSYIFGGASKEKACTADYGDVGGIQAVNCRLAATPMEPSATLQYMVNERPRDWRMITVQFNMSF